MKSLFEKAGLMINTEGTLQQSERLIDAKGSRKSAWQVINLLADQTLVQCANDRELTLAVLSDKDTFPEQITLKSLRTS